MTDRRFAVEFSLSYSEAEPDVIAPLVEKLRLKAIDLGFLQVSEVFTLKEEPLAVCYFTCTLPDGDFTEIGLERQPTEIEFDGFIVPGGMPEWSKWGTVSTSKLSLLSRLLHHAAELGFGSSLSFAGITLDYWRVGGGMVQVQQTWDTVPATD